MGDVYRARDRRLGREVALKVLREDLAFDRDRLARFEQEARAASALNHPNLVTLFDFDPGEGTADGRPTFLTMELVDGPSLRDLAASGRLPVRRVLQLGAQIAEGLAAAHERGIVHRDLKLENIMVTREGRVKILDFGLAKMMVEATPLDDVNRPLATRPGMLFGTPGYMAPEMVRGEAIDYRADQFSLGVLLYQLLAGRRPFAGANPFQELNAVLQAEPTPIDELVPDLPEQLAWVLDRLLAKDPAERYGSTRDLARELARSAELLGRGGGGTLSRPAGESAVTSPAGPARPGETSPSPATLPVLVSGATAALRPERPTPETQEVAATPPTAAAPPRPTDSRRPLLALLAGVVLLALGMGAGWWLRPTDTGVPPRLQTLTYSGSDAAPDLSPDRRVMAFTSQRDGRRRIWLKQLAGGAEAPLTGGSDDHPRFAPDGSSVLFSRLEGASRSLFRVAVVGGEERRVLADAWAGDWSPDGREVAFVRRLDDRTWMLGIARLADGDERELLRIATNDMGPPAWSPDGRTIVVTNGVALSGAPSELHFVDVATGRDQRVVAGPLLGPTTAPSWLADSRAVLVPQIDNVRASHGAIQRVSPDGARRPLFWSLAVGAAAAVGGPGEVIFDVTSVRSSLHELDLVGAGTADRWLTRGHAHDRQPRYSPDGRRLIFSSNRSGNLDLWQLDLTTGALVRLTDDPAEDWDPAWVGDGRQIVWSSARSGNFEIWIAAADGSGARQLTRDGVDAENPTATPDGQWIVYVSLNPEKRGIWRVRPDGSDARLMIPGERDLPEVSPNGQAVLYRTLPTPNSFGLEVARLSDGSRVAGFAVRGDITSTETRGVVLGRARWLPDGSGVAFVAAGAAPSAGDGANAESNPNSNQGASKAAAAARAGSGAATPATGGLAGLWIQDYLPGRDTTATLRPLRGLDLPWGVESFAFSPDGGLLTVASGEQTSNLALASGVAGVD